MRRVHDDHVLDQAGSDFREAFLAARCAALTGADLVRLGADPPDFELRYGDRIQEFEAVEVLAPGRRRGNELKADRQLSPDERSKVRHVPDDAWTSAANALQRLSDAVISKVDAGYPRTTILVVYLNMWPIAGLTRLRAGIESKISPALPHFREVWVWDNDDLHRFTAA